MPPTLKNLPKVSVSLNMPLCHPTLSSQSLSSCIIREEFHFFFSLLSGSVFVPFHIVLECTLRAPVLLSRNHTKVVWKTYEMESEAEVGSGTRTQRGALTLRQLHLFQQLSRSLIRAELLGCVLCRVNRKFSSVTKSCVFQLTSLRFAAVECCVCGKGIWCRAL